MLTDGESALNEAVTVRGGRQKSEGLGQPHSRSAGGGTPMTAWKLAYHANCWGGLGGDALGVTSVTQLAYRTFGDMDRACADIAAAGYAGVELFDGNLLDRSAAEMRRMLADNGLELVATYAGGNFIFDDILPEDLTLFITQMVQADPLIRAVGIGISGVTDREGAIESLAFPALNGFNPKKVLEEQLGITVITENDMHFTSYGFYVRNPCDHPYSLSVLYWPSHRSAGAGTVVDGHIIVGSTKYAGELISLPLINSTATKVETVSRMIHGENIVPLMQTAAVCTIALLNPDILFLTGSATLNVREKDIIDYCKQSIPENHMPVFRMQADIHEEYMTGIFSLTRQALKFKH